MERIADEELAQELTLLLDYNPEGLSPLPSSASLKLKPLSFYDLHLDESLALKKVILTPSLPTCFSRSVELKVKQIHDKKIALPSLDGFPTLASCERRRENGPAEEPQFVAKDYKICTGFFATTIASVFSLHTNGPRWSSVLRWWQNRNNVERTYGGLDEEYGPGIDLSTTLRQDILDTMDENLLQELRMVQSKSPLMATWQVLCANREAEDTLKAMDESASLIPFSSQISLTTGYRGISASAPRPLDATETPWGFPIDSFAKAEHGTAAGASSHTSKPETVIRRSSRLMQRTAKAEQLANAKRPGKARPPSRPHTLTQKQRNSNSAWTAVSLPILVSPSDKEDSRTLSVSLIQHAWARAVEDDSTFIVFYNGNYERIGFRHRSSGSLYLSELIDVRKCIDPAYGKMHIGLFISIIEDALARTRQQVQQELSTQRKSRKRPRSDSEYVLTRKRLRIRAQTAKEIQQKKVFQSIFDAAGARNLVLVRVHHGIHNSPVPSSFIRTEHNSKEKKDYAPEEYMVLTVRSVIGAGATGVTHKATLEIHASGKTLVTEDIVVKLALDEGQRKRMRHEFAVYQHLISSKVTGIPVIFGLFQDVETRTLALVMKNVGVSLAALEAETESDSYKFSEHERDSFIQLLKNIHNAGVRHRDIRPPNLVINSEGVAAIIDFDRAVLNASEGSREREMQHLLDLLNGDYCSPGDQPSLGSRFRSSSLESSAIGSE